jgi:hypothetical protein
MMHDEHAARVVQQALGGPEACLNDPILYGVVQSIRVGIPVHQALSAAVVFLAGERRERMQLELERMRCSPVAPIVLCTGCGKTLTGAVVKAQDAGASSPQQTSGPGVEARAADEGGTGVLEAPKP